MDAFKAQQQIRNNATEISDYLSDLRSWGSEMHKKEKNSKPTQQTAQDLPPIRNQTQTAENLKKKEQLASKYKAEGNNHFKNRKYKLAIASYSKAIESTPYNAVLYSNRSMAKLKSKQFKSAELDCDEAIALDTAQIKAWFRRGLARKALKKYNKALEDFEHVMRLDPKNKAAKKEKIELKQKLDAMYKKSKQRMSKPKKNINDNMRKIVIEECDDSDSSSEDNDNDAIDTNVVEKKEEIGNVEKEKEREAIERKEEVKLNEISNEKEEVFEMKKLPNNFIEFEKIWSRAKIYKHKALILLGLKMKRLDKIIKNMIDDTLFSEMIRTVHYIAMEMELEDAVLILRQLTKLDRFEMIVMFLDETDQKLVSEMKQKCVDNKLDVSVFNKFE